MKTTQEEFWEGKFGNEFIDRINTDQYYKSNIHLFTNILSYCKNVNTVLELGTNRGMNLQAINEINSNLELSGVEINDRAIEIVKNLGYINIVKASITEEINLKKFDLVVIKTVLMHLDPNSLNMAYENLFNLSKKYIFIAEYFSPNPVEVDYRGNKNVLFKRDFAKEMLKRYDLDIVKYGFIWSQDPENPLDDLNWFLLKVK